MADKDARLIDSFLEMMSAERGSSMNTLDAYRRDLDDAREFLGAGSLADAVPDDIRAYMSDISARNFAPSTQARKLSALKQFFRFLLTENKRPDDPTSIVDSPKQSRPLPKTRL